MSEVTERGLTIDELARRTGMTVRNIRAHQSRGLLPAPEIRGRTGYYDDQHVSRLELIRELQGQGFNLEAIRRLLEGAQGSTGEVVRFAQAIRAPFVEEEPRIVSREELDARWGDRADPALLMRAVELGLLRILDDGRIEERSPRLIAVGRELASLGIPTETALDLFTELHHHAQGVADIYVRLFLEEVWKPFEEAGHPQEEWSQVQAALEQLRPLATDSLLAIFQLAMADATEQAFGRVMGQIADDPVDERVGSTP